MRRGVNSVNVVSCKRHPAAAEGEAIISPSVRNSIGFGRPKKDRRRLKRIENKKIRGPGSNGRDDGMTYNDIRPAKSSHPPSGSINASAR
jgi:hypothetical protein